MSKKNILTTISFLSFLVIFGIQFTAVHPDAQRTFYFIFCVAIYIFIISTIKLLKSFACRVRKPLVVRKIHKDGEISMESKIVLTERCHPHGDIEICDGKMIVSQKPEPWGIGKILTLLGVLVLAPFLLIGFMIPFFSFLEFLHRQEVLSLVDTVVFGIASLISGTAWFAFQRLFFTFRATICQGKFSLKNGFLRFPFCASPETTQLIIYPCYDRGDWGYGVHIVNSKIRVFGKKIPFSFVPMGIIGRKYEAFQKAQNLQKWLLKNLPFNVTLQKWDKRQTGNR